VDNVLIRGAKIHTFGPLGEMRSIAFAGERILAVAEGAHDLDNVISETTQVIDGTGLVLIPGLTDTHVHSYEAALDSLTIPVGGSRTIAEMSARIAMRAASAPEGTWLFTTKDWRDSDLAENRPPNRAELDAITTRHPICVRRGSHSAFVNTSALVAAGLMGLAFTSRSGESSNSGALIGDAEVAPVIAFLVKPDRLQRIEALEEITRSYNRRGIVAIRDAGLDREGLETFQDAYEAGRLSVRSRVMVRLEEGWPLADILAEIHRWKVRSGLGDDRLRLDGLKFFVDGRINDAAMYSPCGVKGTLHLGRESLSEAITMAAARGWNVGCHTCGEAAMDSVLDAFEHAMTADSAVSGNQFIIEHAFFLSPVQLERAKRLGVGFSVHPAILYAFASEMVNAFGERVEDVMPVREMVVGGARVAAGSDGHVPPYDPLLGIAVLETRLTSIGRAIGVKHALTRQQAFELYTAAGPRLFGEGHLRGTLESGKLADIVGFTADPLVCAAEQLPEMEPCFTLLGGDPVYDRDEMFTHVRSERSAEQKRKRGDR